MQKTRSEARQRRQAPPPSVIVNTIGLAETASRKMGKRGNECSMREMTPTPDPNQDLGDNPAGRKAKIKSPMADMAIETDKDAMSSG
jgi:hypothetical protein